MKFSWLYSKLQKFHRTFFQPPWRWSLPKKSDVLIYDASGASLLAPYLTKYRVEKLFLRGESVSIACLLRAAITLDFWKGNPILAYAKIFVRAVSPRVVITFIDNNKDFYCLSRSFNNIKTIFLQNGTRGEIGDVFGSLTPSDQYHVDYMLVHGEAIGRMYKKYISGTVIPIGSLINNSIQRSDPVGGEVVLFISQFRTRPDNGVPFLMDLDHAPVYWDQFYAAEVCILRFLNKWCVENHKLLQVAGCSTGSPGAERDFYQTYLTECAWEYVPKKNVSGSYRLVDAANLVVFVDSTLGYESIGRGQKTLALSCRKVGSRQRSAFCFGWPADLPDSGPFWTNMPCENEFYRVIDYVANLGTEEWESIRLEYAKELMFFEAGNTSLTTLLDRLMPR